MLRWSYLEDNQRRLKSRLLKLLDGESAPERLLLATQWPRIDDSGLGEMEKWIDGVETPRLIIVDTLVKIRSSRSGNADRYADDYADVGRIQALAAERGIGILANHHVRKMQSEDYMDDVSGTIGITGAADTVLILRRDRGKHDACLHVTGRDIDERELGLGWDALGCRWRVLGDAGELRMSDARRHVFACVTEHGPITPKQIAAKLGESENNVKQLLHKMRKDGEVQSDNGRYTPITSVTR